MSLKLNSSGGGSVLLQEPSTASNVTFTLPSETSTAIYSNASGNVGIGTSSPDSLTNFRFIDVGSSGTNQGVVQVNNGTVKTAIYANSTDGYLATRTNHNLNLQTNATTQAVITTAGLFQFNSGYGSVATAYGCRAWVNFNGVGTVSITASGNVSSITDNATGDYTVNFTTAFPDANYSFFGNGSNTTNANILCAPVLNWDNPTKTASALRIFNVKTTNGAATDQNTISISVFR